VLLHQTYYSPRSLDNQYEDALVTCTCIHIDSSKLVFKKELTLTKDIVHYKIFKIIIHIIIIDTWVFIFFFFIATGIDMQACPLTIVRNGPKVLNEC
jgi:hypothetical protein